MNKIFFTDLDDTLLTSDKRISKKTLATLKDWLASGNYVAFSSGRPLTSVKNVIAEYDFDLTNVYAIGFNGSMTMHVATGDIVSQKSLELPLVAKICKLCKEHDVYAQAYDSESILVPYVGREIEFYTRTVKLPVVELANFPEDITLPPAKLLCIDVDETGKLDTMKDLLMKTFPDSVTALKSNTRLLEVFNKSAGKGTAVRELCQHLNIPISDSLAAGDQENDISMLEAAGLGIAMSNAKDTVKAAADAVTLEDNNHDGLVKFLLEYM